MSGKKSLRGNARKLVMTAMLSAVAFLLMFLEFPIPVLIPPFVKMDFSELPALIAGFSMGPVSGIAVCLLKNVLHILFKGTTSAGIGELCNFLLGAVFVIPASLIYRRMHNRKGALAGALTGAVLMAVLSLPINFYIVYPAYIRFYGLPLEGILAMYQEILPSADSLIACLTIFNVPFTLVKGLCDAALTFLIYKRISPFIHGKS